MEVSTGVCEARPAVCPPICNFIGICARFGLRVQGVLVGDRETMGLLEVCDHIHWVRDWRRYAGAAEGGDGRGYSPVHSKSLTALYFPNALSSRAARHRPT